MIVKEQIEDKQLDKEIERRVLSAMLKSLYKNKYIDINVYKKVEAEINKS